MARTKGSKNKPKLGSNVTIMNFDKDISNTPVNKFNPLGWVNWGEKNDYPYRLLDLYNTSVTHKACIDFAVNAIIGEGIDFDTMKIDNGSIANPNYHTSWDQFIRQLALDLVLYDSFAFQVIKNNDNLTYTFYHQPIDTVRLEEKDEDGVSMGAYICKDWTNTGTYEPIRLPLFGFQEDETIEKGVPHLFYYRRYTPVVEYYGMPSYAAGLNAIQAEAQFQSYDLKSIVNGFTPSGAITLPQVETEEERRAIIKNVTDLFTGSENANNILITFRNNIEDKPVEYSPFSAPTSNVNLYADSNDRTIVRIMAAHKIPSKALIGYSVEDTGFSNSGEFLEAAFALYNVNTASHNRRELLDTINTMFKSNGVDIEVILKPLRYKIEDMTQTNTDDSNGETTTEESVEEQVV